jgi:hypothetical protein
LGNHGGSAAFCEYRKSRIEQRRVNINHNN